MNSKNVKDIRKQLRNVTQELFPEVLSKELVASAFAELQKEMQFKLEAIQADVNAGLARMEERSKDVHSYILNQTFAEAAKNAPKAAPVTETQNPSTTLEPAAE